jgi:hypothetical protein
LATVLPRKSNIGLTKLTKKGGALPANLQLTR